MSKQENAFRLSQRAKRVHKQPISYLMSQGVTNPHLISLAAGLVDYETLPTSEARELMDSLLADDRAGRTALQYGTTQGLLELREVLLGHMAALDGVRPGDLAATAEDIVVTSGSQQLLFMLADILLDCGDIVITGWPSYFVYTGTLEAVGASIRCVDMDDGGIVPEALDKLLAGLASTGALPRVKILYVCSYHQNPTGITLAADRREGILEIVRKYSTDHRILLVEDAAYRELTFEGRPPLSIKRHDRNNEYVALLQTFSKPFAPGLKTGYGLLPHELIEPVIGQKGNHDFGSANLCQHLALAAMKQGVYSRHLEQLRGRYVRKRDTMLTALQEHLGDCETRWTNPTGGLYVYLTLPDSIDTGADGELFKRAIEAGVLYVPGEFCYGPDATRTIPRNMIRLSFGVAGIDEIRLGIERLAGAIKTISV